MPTTLILGAGTGGSVLASRLSEDVEHDVVLVEAGPDYGPMEMGRWPADLLDASRIAKSHDWDDVRDRTVSIRAKVLGGSSTHNACIIAWGSKADYDEWEPWGFELLVPHLTRAESILGATALTDAELSPWHEGMLMSGHILGIPRISDMNDLNVTVGGAPLTVNVRDGVRMNAAFSYLDHARERKNLRIIANALVDRIVFSENRAIGAVINGDFVRADRTIVAAGAYGSPAILQRSGVGPADLLVQHGIPIVVDLPVGEHLVDHPGVSIEWSPSDRLRSLLKTQAYPEGQVLLRARSRSCGPDSWDLHIFPRLALKPETGEPRPGATIYALKPDSTGHVRIRSRDPQEPLEIDSGFLSSPRDVSVLLDGVALVRALATTRPVRNLISSEVRPGGEPADDYVHRCVSSFFHPTGTCALGKVVDDHGAVMGVRQLYVADASILPSIPRANTHLSIAGVSEYLATRLLAHQ